MPANRLTYETKVGLKPKTVHINQWWDTDANNVKDAINNHADLFDGVAVVGNAFRADSFVKTGGLATEVLLADGSVTGLNTIGQQTLQDVTDLGATTTNDLSTGAISIQATVPGQNLLDLTTFGGLTTLQADDNGSVWSSGLSNLINNTLYGFEAGLKITTGFRNTFNGNLAGSENTTGSSNTFDGYSSGFKNTTGSRNTFTGCESGKFNTTGQLNVFTGNTAGRDNTTGSFNVYTGERAGERINGSNNVLSGHRAGADLLIGSNNVMLGEAVNTGGAIVIDQADDCIVIGARSIVLANSAINEIVIGHVAIGNGSNTTTIGNDSTTNTYLRGTLNLSDLPTSSAGLSSGDIWNNSGVLNIVP